MDSINGLTGVAFKINTEVFDFLNEQGVSKNLLISHEDADIFNYTDANIPNNSKSRELKVKFSKYSLETNIMSLALVYKEEKFYLPIRMDQRSRLYAVPDNLSYQGSNLAKSLFLFA